MPISSTSAADDARERLVAMADLNVLVREPVDVRREGEGPLAGRPIVVKANIAVEGLPHCGGTPALADNIASSSATTVSRLLDAGATIVGQTNLHELALGITSHNAHHGPVRNPFDRDRMALGSSGGSAAAVGGGAVNMALGSDTGGSGRLPAAACGCVGLRPSSGRYPSDGVLNLSTTLDTVSAFGRTVTDVALLDGVLAADDTPVRLVDLNGIRLGVPRAAMWTGVGSQMSGLCEQKLEQIAAAGATLVEVDVASLMEQSSAIAMPIVLAEMEQFWVPLVRNLLGMSLPEFVGTIASPDVAGVFGLVADGGAPDDAVYRHMCDVLRPALVTTYVELFAAHDVIAMVLPTLPVTAPPVGETETLDLDGQEVGLFPTMTDRELPVSLAGLPSISVPAGFAEDGLPYALEFVGVADGDRDLLGLAMAVESVLAIS